MKRRNILLASAATLAAPSIARFQALAQSAGAPDPSRLNGDLTPLGAERAGSADGMVPAWTGGANTPPPGWTPGMYSPDLFAGEAPLFSLTATNMAKYADFLCDGQKRMLHDFSAAGFRMDVYPSHRTACAPQWVYDNTRENVTRAQPSAAGIVYGVQGAFGGPPFPIPSADPTQAGAEIMWNHLMRWQGTFSNIYEAQWVIGNGLRSLTSDVKYLAYAPYYDQEYPDLIKSNPNYLIDYITYTAPSNEVGSKVMAFFSSNIVVRPDESYEYLVGEGRIRQLPGTEYDIPATEYSDVLNYDEVFLWDGALDRYTWKLIGKRQMIVPYNIHKVLFGQPDEVMGLQFVNPDLMRYEMHRCWVIEAHLAPGKRHSEPVRRFFVDEDSWLIMLAEGYDDQNNYWKFGQNLLEVFPDMPGQKGVGVNVYNFQSSEYVLQSPFYKAASPLGNPPVSFAPIARSLFEPQSMANSGGL